MRSVNTPLQQAYFTLLNGQINVGGVIPIYDTIPSNETYPYIQIDDNTKLDYVTKSSFGEEITQTIWIVDRYEGSFGSRLTVNSILNRVQEIIRARPNPFDITDYNVITNTLDIAVFSRERTETHTYLRYEVRFRHLIQHLNYS